MVATKAQKPITIVRGPNGSSFITCDKCSENVHVLFVATHGCDISQEIKDSIVTTCQSAPEKKVTQKKSSSEKKATAGEGDKPAKASKKRPLDENGAEKAATADKVVQKKGSSKKAKEEGAPKRPMAAYFYFTADEREKMKTEGKTGGVTEFAKACGEKWKSMSEEDKKPFMEMAEQDKERYRKERNVFEGRGEDEDKPVTSSSTGPKKPQTAYFLFAAEQRAKNKADNTKLSVTECGKVFGERWKALSDEEKKVYQDAAVKDKERYEREKNGDAMEIAEEEASPVKAENSEEAEEGASAEDAEESVKAEQTSDPASVDGAKENAAPE